ncbi:hypothetical protein FRB94_004777 [Tulasnella sp. JGI-2019a]|nr:hypothetical protein FRB94_004777 [Tulasnella sp. JGI-2019a]KAG9033372.1 hypothetical protein FRB95_014914 [Tulasnella sp. JGI-2019a]
MCSTSSPRPILKHTSFRADQSSSSSCHGTASQRSAGSAVRFPSSPKMSTVYWTHCPNSYDRRPIVVLPNSCALPDRGQRDLSGASSSPQMGQTSLPQSWGNHVHPSIFGRMCSSGSTSSDEDSDQRHSSEEIYGDFSSMSMVPSLTHDDVSSEESDGIASPPPEQCHGVSSDIRQPYNAPSQSHLHSEPLSHPPISDYYVADSSNPSADYSLAFLPHAPSSSYTPRKRSDKKRLSVDGSPFSQKSIPTIGGNSWTVEADDSSCLGGF